MKQAKTNVMRLLDAAKIEYESFFYDVSDNLIDGISVADKMGQPRETVFKTLATTAPTGEVYVFVLPVAKELNLKKAAAAAGVKSIAMLPQKDLLGKTGYVHGECSPIGLKKPYPVIVDSSADSLKKMIFSGGKVGAQVKLAPDDLQKMVQAKFFDITN